MKRYTIKSYGIDDWDEVEKDNGIYMKFTDHQAEIDKRDELLNRAIAALSELQAMVKGECPQLLNEDSGGTGRLDIEIDAILAQKDSTQ